MLYNQRSTAVREKLVLQVGKPVTIALEYSTGKLVGSNIPGAPDQVYYTLTDGRAWYADLAASEMIDKLDLVSREPFTLCKLGAGRFEVERAGDFPTEPIASQPTANRVQPQRAATRIGADRAGTAANNDRALREQRTAPSSQTESIAAAQPVTKLEQALKTAILASANAEKYGAEIGYTVRFTPEAIKCMAISVLIGMEQGGRR
jgi:hypothetical protein